MITSYCYGHSARMDQRFSHTKKDEKGNPKPYFSHIDPDGNMCFGIGKPPAGEYKKTAEVIEEIEEENTKETEAKIKEFEETIAEEDDESPMKKSDWRRKDEMIARLTLAKAFIAAGVDFDNAMDNGDLDKWTYWVTTGKILK